MAYWTWSEKRIDDEHAGAAPRGQVEAQRRRDPRAAILGAVSVPASDATDLIAALRRPRLAALGVLGVCALVTGALSLAEGDTGPVDRRYTMLALALGAVSIFARRTVPGGESASRLIRLQQLSCAAAAGLGGLGLALALRDGQASVGLLYCVAGALLLLRPAPRRVVPRPPPPRR
jgi:hypothetical protein